MTVYATPAELAAYLDPDSENPPVPPLATVLLRSASALVDDYTAGAVYRTSGGLPTDQKVLTALKDATLEQASAWSINGIDPRKGAVQAQRRVQSKSMGGISVTYLADPAADSFLSTLASGTALVSQAYSILRAAGLITSRITTASAPEYFNVAQIEYDPLTGELQP